MFSESVFKKYDIRGIYGEDFDLEFVKDLAKAYCTYLIENNESDDKRSVSIGYDARLSSETIKDAFISGIKESGYDAVDIGLSPTPLLYFSLFQDDFSGGVMITASHNPPEYNGFKICIGNRSVYGDTLIRLREIIRNGVFKSIDGADAQEIRRDFSKDYLNYCEEYFKRGNKRIKAAVDAGNGTGGQLLAEALRNYGCEVHELYIEPDGSFPNHHPDPAKEENLRDLIECVKDNGLDIGIALDGDGDRLGVIDDRGMNVSPDIYMILFARDILKKHPGATFISEVKCSDVLYDEVKKAGGRIVMYKTGHSLIKDKMREEGALLSGEMSGHIFFADDYYGYDDAIYSALRLVKILMDSNKSLSSLVFPYMIYESTPEIRILVPENKKSVAMKKLKDSFFDLEKKNDTIKEIITIDGLRVLFDNGWGLVRLSNTEPHLVLRFEATDRKSLDDIKELMMNMIDNVLD